MPATSISGPSARRRFGGRRSDRTQALADEVAERARRTAAEAARRMQETAERVAEAAQDVAGSGEPLKVDGTDVGKGWPTPSITSRPRSAPLPTRPRPRFRRWSRSTPGSACSSPRSNGYLVTGMLPKVHSAIDRVEATPGAGEVVRTALEPIMARLDDWSEKRAWPARSSAGDVLASWESGRTGWRRR